MNHPDDFSYGTTILLLAFLVGIVVSAILVVMFI